MAIKNKTTLKTFFQTGDIPTENEYADFIDSTVILDDNNSGNITLSGHLTASGNISASGTITGLTGSFTTYTNANFGSSDLVTTGNISLTHVTASGNVSSSGNLSITGDLDVDGKSHFTGHITASGNISASGTIFADNFQSTGGNVNGISFTDDLNLVGNLTSSGNISSSGTVFATALDLEGANIKYIADENILKFGDNIKLGIGEGVVDAVGDLTIQSDGANVDLTANVGNVRLTTSAGDTIIQNSGIDGDIILKTDNSGGGQRGGQVLISGSNSDIRLDVRGNVTASGNISSSSDITSNNITAVSTGSFGRLEAGTTSVGALTATTLNTGQGDNELYDMNQNVTTTSAVTFATVNTGQGNNELYDMDQNVKTTSSPTFSFVSLTNSISFSQVLGNSIAAAFGDGGVDIGGAYGGIITISGVPATTAKLQIINFRITASRCREYMIIVANSNDTVLVNPNAIRNGEFFLNLSCGAESFAGGTLKINFQILAI